MGHFYIRKHRNTFISTTALLALAACGGGGGGGKGGSGSGGTQSTNPTQNSAPDTTITTKPDAVSNSSSAAFNATSTIVGSTFEASVDGAAFSAVTLPLALTNLSDGAHTISIRARVASGSVDDSPATYAWSIDTHGPTASIAFPPPVSYTDADKLTVRGTSADANGISAIKVNGVDASSRDGFLTWSVEVPITVGSNQLVVSSTDSLGNTSSSAASASVSNRGPAIASSGGFVYDESTKRLIVADRSAGAIYSFDEHGVGTVLVARDYTDVVPIGYHGIVLDSANNRALLLKSVTVNALNLTSGQITGVSYCSNDTSIGMSKAEALAIDPAHARAFLITSENSPTVASIDLSSGNCTVIASGTVGTGQALQSGSAIEYDGITDPANPRLLVGSTNNGNVVAIDIATGARTVLSSKDSSYATTEMKLDADHNRLLVLDSKQAALFGVDLQDGTRTLLGAISRPSHGLAIAADGTIFAGEDPGEILRINSSATAAETLVHSQVGDGPRMTVSYGLAIEQPSGVPTSLLVSDLSSLSRIDLATGNRTIVSSASVGGGPYTGRIANFAIDTRPNHTGHAVGIMRGNDYSLVSIDLATGDRDQIADLGLPSATHVVNEIRVDAANNRAIVVDIDSSGAANDALYAIDLATGQRRTISDNATGGGDALHFPSSLVLEPASNPTRAIVSNGNAHNLLSIDLATGARSIFSTGAAPQFLPGPLTLDSTNGRLLGADDYGFNVFSAPLSTGIPQAISGFDAAAPKLYGHGPTMVGASGTAIDPRADVAYVTQPSANSVIAIDLQTGDRVLLSR